MNKLYRCVSTILLFTLISCNSNSIGPILPQPQSYFEWAKTYDSNGGILGGSQGIVLDSKGNSYIFGIFAGTTKFDSILVQNAPLNTACQFLAKYDSKGNALWVKWARQSEAKINSIDIDPADNIIITGKFNSGTKFFSNNGLLNQASLVKINESGNLIWSLFTSDYAIIHKVDNYGNILQISDQGSTALKLFKISSQGDIILSKDLAISATLSVTDMSITDNSFFLTGGFSGKVVFGNVTMNVVDVGGCYYLAKFDLGGNCLWAVNTDTHSGGHKVAFDNSNNRVIVFGVFDDGMMKLENITLGSGLENRSMFLASYSSDGKLIWVYDLKAGPTSGGGLCIDRAGNIYLTNGLHGKLEIGKNNLESSSGEVFIAKLNSNEDLIWIEKTYNSLAAFPQDIKVDSQGNVNIIGYFQHEIFFGNKLLTGSGFFIAKCLDH